MKSNNIKIGTSNLIKMPNFDYNPLQFIKKMEVKMDLTVLDFEITKNVAVITMNNPPINALTPVFLKDFDQVFKLINRSEDARSVLIASKCPDFFSVGDDVTKLKEIDDDLIALQPKAQEMMNTLEALPLPVVAAINGHALGGGLELALCCDFRFMGEGSGVIGLPEVRLGMIPAFGGTQRLPQIIGKTRAFEMMVKGLQIKPEEAKNIGLINDVFSKEDLYEKSFNYAKRLARQATGAIASIKRCVQTGLNEGIEKGLLMEQALFKENIIKPDVKEGIDAFLNGRKPEFTGK
jgi:enoyl-CoA hydratase/carnithine racemase